MFFKKESKQPTFDNININTILGEGLEFSNGNIKGCGDVRIDGILIGDVDINGGLIISDTGYVRGNINATYAQISGKLEGDVLVTGMLQLTKMANIQGDVECGSLSVEESAVFCGMCTMTGKNEKRKPKGKTLEGGFELVGQN